MLCSHHSFVVVFNNDELTGQISTWSTLPSFASSDVHKQRIKVKQKWPIQSALNRRSWHQIGVRFIPVFYLETVTRFVLLEANDTRQTACRAPTISACIMFTLDTRLCVICACLMYLGELMRSAVLSRAHIQTRIE